MDINQPLDQAQIADAVNRQKVGTQRQRNEMMRLGTSDPNSFAMQNQKQIQDAQQPAEFWGAGRKIAEDQAPDLDAAGVINPLVKLGGVYNYYGDTDSSSAKWGTPYGKTDLGGGKYNILGSQGQNLGTGYKSLSESIGELYKGANAPTAVSKWKDYTGTLDTSLFATVYGMDEGYNQNQSKLLNQQKFADAGYRLNPTYIPAGYTEDGVAVGSQYQKMFNGYDWKGTDYDTLDQANAARDATGRSYATGNNIRDWEILGQLLTQGNITGNYGQTGSLGGNQIADKIGGLNTLYGSTPLVFKDKLYGYKNALGDTTPVQHAWDKEDLVRGKWTTAYNRYYGTAGLGREYTDTDWWSKNTKGLGNNNYFVTPEKAAENPGWYNKDYYDPHEIHINTPSGRVKDTRVGVAIGNMIGSYFGVPIGSLISAAQNYDAGNTKQGNAALGQAAISYATSGMDFGINTGYGAVVDGALQSAATGAISGGLGSLINGSNDFGKSMLLGGLGGAGGSLVGGLTSQYGPAISGAASGFTSGAIRSLGSKNMLESALQSGAAGGLGGLFTQVGDVKDKNQIKFNNQAGQQIVKLAQIFRNNNGSRKTTGR
jgi:hypothetical protein